MECLDRLIRCGIICCNQTPMVAGVNDDPQVLSDLFTRLSWIGCPPYYVFQMRPATGNKPFGVPIVRGWQIFRLALRMGSGLARRARFVMSHATGKIEILCVDQERIYLRYHRARTEEMRGKLLICRRDDDAYWLDDLEYLDSSDSPDTILAELRSRPCLEEFYKPSGTPEFYED